MVYLLYFSQFTPRVPVAQGQGAAHAQVEQLVLRNQSLSNQVGLLQNEALEARQIEAGMARRTNILQATLQDLVRHAFPHIPMHPRDFCPPSQLTGPAGGLMTQADLLQLKVVFAACEVRICSCGSGQRSISSWCILVRHAVPYCDSSSASQLITASIKRLLCEPAQPI